VNIMDRTGGSFWTNQLARDYGFTEDDGSIPPFTGGLSTRMSQDEIPEFWRGVERF
jgi:dehydrogenase/reductase SDR family member 1